MKTIGKIKSRNGYQMNHLDRYDNGMSIVGINKADNIGVCYIKTDIYHKSTACMTLGAKCNSIFSKLLKRWDDFLTIFIQLLPFGTIISNEIYEKSITHMMLISSKSLKRFQIFCLKHNFKCELVDDNSSVTDLVFNGIKAQMKFASLPENTRRTYSYKVLLGKNGKNDTSNLKIPYEKGDNDIYIIELGTHQGDFLFLPESLLIEKGYIKTYTQTGKRNLNVYLHDYVEVNRLLKQKHVSKIKGNWTCDKFTE